MEDFKQKFIKNAKTKFGETIESISFEQAFAILDEMKLQSKEFNCFLEDSEQGLRCDSKCKDCKDYKG